MGIKGFFRNFLDEKKTVEISVDYSSNEIKAAVEAFALNTVIGFVASLLASCEFKTYEGGKPVKGGDWYILNALPNRNATKSEFWQEFWQRLLFCGEALIVPRNGELVIADSFTTEKYVAFDTVFRGVSRDGFELGDKRISDVFYIQRRACKEQSVIRNVLQGYAELIGSASAACVEESSHKGILDVPSQAQGAKDFEEKFKKLMADYFSTFFKNKNAVLPLWGGMKYTPVQSKARTTSAVSDYRALYDDAVKRCAQSYGVSPALVSGDVAGIEEALDFTLTACIDPLAEAVSAMLTARNYSERQICNGRRIVIDTSGIRHNDPLKLAANIDKLISCGMYSIDELRERLGEYQLDEPWSRQHFITKNYEDIESAGGEENV